MYRRRRTTRESIAFGFDSFLDLVANVIGIIVRLILVAWVGGRSYSALMTWVEPAPEPAPVVALPPETAAPRRHDDPLAEKIAEAERDLDRARARLLAQLEELKLAEARERTLEAQAAALSQTRQALAAEQAKIAAAGSEKEQTTRLVALTLDDLQRRQQELLARIKSLETKSAPTRVLRFRTPVSRSVHADEVFFECKQGRVTFIDVPAFLQEVEAGMEQKVEQLRTAFEIVETTRPVGAFRLKYVVERERDNLDDVTGTAKPRSMFNFRYGMTEWVVEPVTPIRGETLEQALTPGSAFRRRAETFDPATVATFWVYPDSFSLFRGLRDFLYERGVEVAGRPLPDDAPIAASRYGSASRGQ